MQTQHGIKTLTGIHILLSTTLKADMKFVRNSSRFERQLFIDCAVSSTKSPVEADKPLDNQIMGKKPKH